MLKLYVLKQKVKSMSQIVKHNNANVTSRKQQESFTTESPNMYATAGKIIKQ